MLSLLTAIALTAYQSGPPDTAHTYPVKVPGKLFHRYETPQHGECTHSWWIGYGDGRSEPVEVAPSANIDQTTLGPTGTAWVFAEGRRQNGHLLVQRVAPITDAMVNGKYADPVLKNSLPRDAFPAATTQGLPDRTALAGLEDHKFLTLCVRFSDTKSVGDPHLMDWYTRVSGTTFPGLVHYYRESSAKRMSIISPQIIGWLNLPGKADDYKSGGSWDVQKMMDGAMPLVDSKVNFKNIWGVNFFPNVDDNSGFSYASSAFVNSVERKEYVPVTSLNPWTDQFVLVHENGHNLGFDHSSVPGGVYQSDWSPMGNGGRYGTNTFDDLGSVACDHNSYHKSLMGWIAQNEITAVLPNTIKSYRVERTDKPVSTTDPRMLRVYLPGYGSKYYTVESRKFSGYDNDHSLHGEGVIIHLVDYAQAWNPGASRLIDRDNDNGGAGAIWAPGQTFVDEDNGIKIAVTGSDIRGFTINVTNAAGGKPGVVTNTAATGAGSLREALVYAEDNPGTTVTFAIQPTDSGYSNGVYVIRPTGTLPGLTAPGTVLDGRTQTAFKGNSNKFGPEILIDDSLASGQYGISVNAPNCTVAGVSFANSQLSGIFSNAKNTKIVSCQIGLDATGQSAAPNGGPGIYINGDGTDMGAIIGGKSEGNVISGNQSDAIALVNAGAGSVTYNLIGTSADGKSSIGNSGGVYAESMKGTIMGPGNVVCGSGSEGFDLTGCDGIKIFGAKVGLLPNGTSVSGNGTGVAVRGASTNIVIGDDSRANGNTIVGNGKGVSVSEKSSNVTIKNNYIGCTATSRNGTANSGDGVAILTGSNGNLVANNVVSSNGSVGVRIAGSSSSTAKENAWGNTIDGNWIGVSISGAAAWPNATGINIHSGANLNVVSNNVCSGNTGNGIEVQDSGSNNNSITGNKIGVDTKGKIAVANGGGGIWLIAGAANTTITGNQIGGNVGDGITIYGNATRNTVIVGNEIGSALTKALGNRKGVAAWDSGATSVGQGAGLGNTISNNLEEGVVVGGSSKGISIRGNSMKLNGMLGINLDRFNGPNTVTPNDSLDLDIGPNNLTNYPSITITGAGDSLTASLVLNAAKNKTYTVDIYSVKSADPTGYGEGETLVYSVQVTTDANGFATVAKTFDGSTSIGLLTATATETGNTSEFGPVSPGFTIPRLQLPSVSGNHGQTVDLMATVLDRQTGAPIAGRAVTFSVQGVVVGTATTDANGIAKVSYTVPSTGSSFAISASISATTNSDANVANATLTAN